MGNIVVLAEHVSKQYRLGQINYGRLAKDLQGWWARLRGKEDPNQVISENMTNAPAMSGDRFWALKDICFEIEHGQRIGIIGKNGAGKSTLLKILSRVTTPTEGIVKIRGKVASLLEVGTGFNPELTGRENVFLNGAILGMKKAEVHKKFDEIVDFSEVERFIDTPVKRYSSGMYVRLAFAVAAHLEPDILIVDEVLAVGDLAFQRKCLGKLETVSTEEGRTVLFVSHNMGAISRLCTKAILLEKGCIRETGLAEKVIGSYVGQMHGADAEVDFVNNNHSPARISLLHAALRNSTGEPTLDLDRCKAFSVHIRYQVNKLTRGAHIGVMIDKADGAPVCHTTDLDAANPIDERKPGEYETAVRFPGEVLNAGIYTIRIAAATYGGDVFDYREPFVFTLFDSGTFASRGANGQQRPGVLALLLAWDTEKLD